MKKKFISLLTAFSMTLMMFGSPNISAADNAHTHKVCGDLSCTDSGHTDISNWVGTNSLSNLEDGKHYYLTDDVTLSNAADENTNSDQSAITIDSGKNVTICLNGHKISIQDGVQARIFYIKGNGSLTLCDCSSGKTGTLTGGKANGSGGAVYVFSGSFTMYGGTISNNTASNSGGGVYVNASGTFTMDGGKISGNTATTDGGGVYNTGTFTMTGGTISGNTASGIGGGVYVDSSGKFEMSGNSTISDNTSISGGGVYMKGDSAKFAMRSGTISRNKATGTSSGYGQGGGVVAKGTFEMSGGTISDNTSISVGGGVLFFGGEFTIDGTVDISGNKKTSDNLSNNVHLNLSEKITIGNGFGSNSNIGVTAWSTHTCKNPVNIATEATENIIACFKPDVPGESIVWDSTTNMFKLKGAHSATETEKNDATCTEKGNINYWYCSVCEKYFSDEACTTVIEKDNTVIAAEGHKTEKVEANAATCTADGNKEYWYCSNCKKYFSNSTCTTETTLAATVITKTGHSATKTAAKAATCTAGGNVEYWYCSACKNYFSDEACTKATTEENVTIAATGHSYDTTTWKSDENNHWHAATCEHTTKTKDKTGHTWGDWTVTQQATEETEGSEERKCEVCNYTETKTIPVLAHTHNLTKHEKVDADCVTAGTMEYWYCSACETYFSDEACTKVITAADTVIAMTEHSYSDDWSKNTTEHWHECTVCHDKKDTKEHTREEFSEKAATCTEPGLKAGVNCSVCGAVLKNTESIPALGHSVDLNNGKITKEPTCTEKGKKTFSCTRGDCDYTETAEIEALGHSFTNYASNNNATCTADGTRTAKCDRCNETKTVTDEGSKKAHSFVNGACENCGAKDPNAGKEISWEIKDGTLTISGTGDMYNFTEENAPWHDKKDEITNVVIEDGITSIGDNAFEDCKNLTAVTIPDSVTDIGDNAFKGTGLTEVTIPDSVKDIGNGAFADCDDLKNVTFDGTTPPAIGEGVFDGSDNLEQISVPEGYENAYKDAEGFDGVTDNITDGTPDNTGSCGDKATWTYDEENKTLTITGSGDMTDWNDSSETPWSDVAEDIEKVDIGDGITSIGDNAFEGCENLTAVTIPDSVTDIGDNAFKGTGLTEVTIPDSVTEIGNGAFADCPDLDKVTFEGTTPPAIGEGVFDGSDNLEQISVPEGYENAYKDAEGFDGVTDNITDGTPDNTGSCGDEATWTYDEENKTLTITGSGDMTDWNDSSETPWSDVAEDIEKVDIGDGITSIGDNAFEGCENLTDVTIPDTVTDIGDNAFKGTGLTEVTIPDSVKDIGDGAFADCDDLKNVTFDGTTPPAIGDKVFDGSDNLEQISVPEGYENAYKDAEGFDGVTDNITDGTPDNTGSCGDKATWTYDEENKTLTITGGGDMTDWNDSSETPWSDVAEDIEKVVIDDGITSIGDSAFEGCENLTDVTIPDSVTDIGDNAFKGTGLTEVTIPDSVKDIGENAFADTEVDTVYYPTDTDVKENSFPDSTTQVEYSVTDDGDIIIENIISEDDTVVIPEKIGDRDIVGVDEKVQDKVSDEGHTHTGGKATCIQTAKCAICGAEYGELADHALNKTEAKAPTCTEDGNDAYRTCSECGKIFSDENGTTEIEAVTIYPATGHTYSEAWDSDADYHWHSAACGHDSIFGKEVHTWDEGAVTAEPTEEAEGVKTYICTVCSETKTESIDKLIHTHTYSDEWTSGETSHWHEATCGHTEISGEAAHTEDNGTVTTPPTTETEGVRTFACSVCGYVMRTETIPQLEEEHTHNFSTDWKHDETGHWHECDCGEKTEFSEHTDNGGIETVPPTEASAGTMTYSCDICGYVIRTEEIPALAPVIPDHTHAFGSEWEYDPAYHWHKCECGEKSEPEEHAPSGWIVETPATTDKEGVQIKVCTVCGIELDRRSIAPAKVQDTAGTNTELVQDDKITEKVLTDEEIESVYDVIFEVTAKPTNAEHELISAELKSNETVGMCVDLSLFKVKDGNIEEKIPVSETSGLIGITLTIPDSIYAPERSYFAVRVHDGNAENIGGTYDRTNRTLTFYTDKFSIYAIAYTASSVNNVPTIPSPPSVPSKPSVSVVTPTVTETTEKTEDKANSDDSYIDDVSSAAGINETDDNSQAPFYMLMIVIIIAAVGFSSIIIVKRFAKKKR